MLVDEAVAMEVSFFLGGGSPLISSEAISAEVPCAEVLGFLDSEGIGQSRCVEGYQMIMEIIYPHYWSYRVYYAHICRVT